MKTGSVLVTYDSHFCRIAGLRLWTRVTGWLRRRQRRFRSLDLLGMTQSVGRLSKVTKTRDERQDGHVANVTYWRLL